MIAAIAIFLAGYITGSVVAVGVIKFFVMIGKDGG